MACNNNLNTISSSNGKFSLVSIMFSSAQRGEACDTQIMAVNVRRSKGREIYIGLP